MRIAVSIIALLMAGVLVVPSDCSVDGASWFDRYVSSPVRGAGSFISGAYHGAGDMWRSYSDMRKANTIGADKYFHARGNYDAAQRGPGGRWAAKVISNARESWQGGVSGRGAEDTQADQEANRWGRNGGNPNVYRPRGLGREY